MRILSQRMLKSVFIPNQSNAFAWSNVLLLITLVAIGEIEAYAVLFGYFLETIVIGIFNCVKMYASSKHNDRGIAVYKYILFFIVHYGFFIAVQSIFVFAFFSFDSDSFVKEPFHLIENYIAIFNLEGMPLIMIVLSVTQLIKYIFDFHVPKKYMKYKVKEIMFKPYLRIVIQQVAVIVAGFFIILSSGSVAAAILLILLRAIVDFILVGIRENSAVLEYFVEKSYDGKISKDELRKQILLLTE